MVQNIGTIVEFILKVINIKLRMEMGNVSRRQQPVNIEKKTAISNFINVLNLKLILWGIFPTKIYVIVKTVLSLNEYQQNIHKISLHYS